MRAYLVGQLYSEILEYSLSCFCGRENTASRDDGGRTFTKSAIRFSDRHLSLPRINQRALSEQLARSKVGSWMPRRL